MFRVMVVMRLMRYFPHRPASGQLSGWWILLFLLLTMVSVLSGCRNGQEEVAVRKAESLRAFAGAPARVVWVQDMGDNRDVSARGNRLRLMGYDSEDGLGERVLLPGPENFYRPLITPSGRQIVFSDFHRRQVRVVDWSGKHRRDLTLGRALAVWRDPASGVDWVYVGRSTEGEPETGSTRLYRVQLDNPQVEEPVWDTMPFGDAVHLSGDGRFFSAEIANADCALIDTGSGEARRYGKGCWPAVSPDRSHRFWFFDGSHRNLEMVDTRQGTRSRIHLASAPGIEGEEVYHPRWSNNPRFMVMTGPYRIRQGGNNIRGGGAGVEVYAGRFNSDFTGIEAWFEVSSNQRADFYPDLWVAGNAPDEGGGTALQESVAPEREAPEPLQWPVVKNTLIFAWDNAAAKNEWTGADGRLYQAKIIAEGMARFGLNYRMDLRTGWYGADRLPGPDPREYEALKAVTLAFVAIRPPGRKQGDGLLLTLGGGPENRTRLRVEQGGLVLEEQREGRPMRITRLGQLPAGASLVLLELDSEQVRLRIDRTEARTYPGNVTPVRAWPLIFGTSRQKEGPGWNGLLERVALYGGRLDTQEQEQLVRDFFQKGKTARPVKPVTVRAELVSASTLPLPEDILPYRRGLVVEEYRVVELLQGELEEREILVARWVILDGKRLSGVERSAGTVYELQLDAFDNRPELEGERLSMESDNLLLPMYYQLDFSF